MRNILLGLLGLAMIATGGNAWAWGQNGHRVIGQIAQNHLSSQAAAQVRSLLPESSLAEVSTWADEMRSNPSDMWQGMHHWHYINLNKPADFSPAAYRINADTPHKEINDIYAAMLKSIAVLKSANSPAEDKAFHLKLLTHMVGDIHQPMHAGHKHDKGGNDIDVEFFGDITNLHALWDTRLIESQNLSFSELAGFIDTQNRDFITESQSSSPADWVIESHQLAQELYQQPKERLSYGYIYQFMPLAKERLLLGGVRLAGLLNQIFDGPTNAAASSNTVVTAGSSHLSTQKNNR